MQCTVSPDLKQTKKCRKVRAFMISHSLVTIKNQGIHFFLQFRMKIFLSIILLVCCCVSPEYMCADSWQSQDTDFPWSGREQGGQVWRAGGEKAPGANFFEITASWHCATFQISLTCSKLFDFDTQPNFYTFLQFFTIILHILTPFWVIFAFCPLFNVHNFKT